MEEENASYNENDKTAYYLLIALKLLSFILVLTLFLVSIQLMGASLKMFGKGLAESLMTLTANPFVGLFIGILATSLIQSSSTTTSILVGLAAGGVIPVANAIPMVMGANIGTSVTNTIVGLAHLRRRKEFERAFGAAIVHDFFNLLAVLVLLPIELVFHPLEKLSLLLTRSFINLGGIHLFSPLKILFDPIIHLLKMHFDSPLFLLILAIGGLFFSLTFLVRLMKSLIIGRIEVAIDGYLFKNIYTAFLLGMLFTALIQSSSITTSLVVPLVGAGFLTVKKIFPYTLGANVGTTITAIMAALATVSPVAVTIAFAHLLFNLGGIILVVLIFKYWPVTLAQKFARICAQKKRLALGYIVALFFVVPLFLIFLTKIS